jgi:spore cortex biosynthesis protein YabQ
MVMMGFFNAIACGLAVSMLYDFFRIKRRSAPSKNRIARYSVHLEDLLFWAAAAVIVFLGMFSINGGEYRGYLLFGIGAGALIYQIIFSKPVINGAIFLIDFIVRIVILIIQVITIPFYTLYRIAASICRKIKKRS